MIILLIYKWKVDNGDCSKYRGISLIYHLAKVYVRILNNWLRGNKAELREQQYRYRSGRSTIALLFALGVALEKIIRRHIKPSNTRKKVFDSVFRVKMWRTLKYEYGVV